MSFAGHVRKISPRAWFYFKALRYKFYNGQPDIWLLRHCTATGTLAIDIGASIGLYSRELAKSAAQVIAFEANPRVAAFARLVMPPKVTVESVALSSASREMTLRIPINKRNNPVDDLATVEPRNALQADLIITQPVVARRLDDYGYRDCGFIKIDVEGHEEQVLEGGLRLIEKSRPILMIELDDRFNPGILGRVCKRLTAYGYMAYEFSGGRLLAISQCEPPDDANASHNVVFVPNKAKLPVLPRWDRFACALRLTFGQWRSRSLL